MLGLGQRRPHTIPDFLQVPWSVKDLFVFVAAWFGLQVAVVLGLGALAPMIPAVAQFLQDAQANQIGADFALNLLDAATGLAVMWWYLHRYHVGWREVGWRRFSLLKTVGYLLALMVAFLVAANLLLALVSVLVPGFNENQAQSNEFIGATATHPSLALIALVLLPPVLEETIFRGFLFPALAKKWGMVWGAVISSVVFGIAHWQANVSIYTFVLGLVLCFMYVRLRSIFPGMLLHMLNNLSVFLYLPHK